MGFKHNGVSNNKRWSNKLMAKTTPSGICKYHNMETETRPRISVLKAETLKYTLKFFPLKP